MLISYLINDSFFMHIKCKLKLRHIRFFRFYNYLFIFKNYIVCLTLIQYLKIKFSFSFIV